MKVINQQKNNFVLRFDKGEEVLEGIKTFMAEQAISACVFFGIGACAGVELNFFNEHLKDYRVKPYVENMEILSLTGNGGLNEEGNHALHAHGMFGKIDFTIIGGHVSKLTVSVTCEIFLIQLEGALERKLNPDFNLSLLA